MEIRQLRTFIAVAKFSSFTHAADHLNYAQSTVSAQIQALEDEFQVPLFERLGQRIILTEAGERLLQYAERLLGLTEETRAGVVGGKDSKGSLTVRLPESLGVYRFPEIFSRFVNQFPQIRINIINCAHEGLERDLRKGIINIAFLLHNSFNSSDLNIETVGAETMILVAHPAHPLTRLDIVNCTDLHNETILLSGSDCSYRRDFEQALKQSKVKLGPVFEYTSIASLKESVCVGIGISILPKIAVHADVKQGRLVALPWQASALHFDTIMIHHKDKWLSPVLTSFMSISREVLGTTLSTDQF